MNMKPRTIYYMIYMNKLMVMNLPKFGTHWLW